MPKISALPAAASVNLTDILPEVSPAVAGTTYKATFQQVYDAFALGGAALTRTNDTNVTVTLGGSPTTALLNAASLTLGWTGVLSVARGGTNASSASITSFNNITGYTASGATGTTSTNLVFSTSPTLTTASLVTPTTLGVQQQALNMNSNLINNVTDPSSAQDAATKAYVDAVATGLNVQAACVCASAVAYTAAYDNGASGVGATLTNTDVQAAFEADGVSPTVGQRVLIKDQASTLQNGIYTVTVEGDGSTDWVLTRATDFDTPAEIQPGDLVPVVNGTDQAGSSWMQTATVATVGTDAVTFIQFSASIPVNVASGGTGNTSATAYAVLTGGTTSTGAFQSIASVGTASQVLTSNGAGMLPTMQDTIQTVKTQIITSSNTYTPSTGMLFCEVELVGGGGGGGGGAGVAATSSGAGGGGGGAGYCKKLYTAALLGATAAVVIGTGGAAGAAGANNGSSGVDSTFTPAGAGAVLTAAKGTFGLGGAATTTVGGAGGGTGGTGTNGDVNITGSDGNQSIVVNGAAGFAIVGMGGGTALSPATLYNAASVTGTAGVSYGAGGSGGYGQNTDAAGGAGKVGICIITEYCNQ